MTFSVLTVCTGNVCRSPMAEYLLRARLSTRTAAPPVGVASAGTRALAGYGMDGPSALALKEIGVDGSVHVARQLTPDLVRAAELILTAETAHRSSIVRAEPMAMRRTFTLREFARLGAGLAPLAEISDEALRSRVGEVAAQRGWVDPPQPGADEIGDPFGAPLDVARSCAGQIAAAVDGVLAALGLPVHP